MIPPILRLLSLILTALRLRSELALENLALRQQLAVLHRQHRRPKLRMSDRVFWCSLSRSWSHWKEPLGIVKPETVLRWHRRRFASYWTRLSRSGRPGRPRKDREIRALIRRVAGANPTWVAPRLHGELLKLGMDIQKVVIAPHSPWQTPYVERVIGTLRRECPDHVIVLGEKHLRQVVPRFVSYYHESRTHLALDKDAPERRAVQPPPQGRVIEIPQVGGLHHRYERRVA